MSNTRNLQKAPSGYYFLRLQRDGQDHRTSLKTKDLSTAKVAAAIAHATLSSLKIDPSKIKDWALETNGQDIIIKTEDNDAGRASALEAVKIITATAIL